MEPTVDVSLMNDEDLNLEEFVDVVTTYRCKFCKFNCSCKEELMVHIKSTHIKKLYCSYDSNVQGTEGLPKPIFQNPSKLGIVNLLQTTNKDDLSEVSNELSTVQKNHLSNYNESNQINTEKGTVQLTNISTSLQEGHAFFCGQCDLAFADFDACRQHVVLEHQYLASHPEPQETKLKRKPKKKRQYYEIEYSPRNKKDKGSTIKDYTETLSKRKIKPPRALSEDYYLLSRKRQYIRRQDPQEKQFRCQIGSCGQHFASEENLDLHNRCHMDDGSDGFDCMECHEKCEHWRVMTMHLWRIHQIDLDLFACSECNYRSYSPFKLENHRRIHSTERNFKCNVCDKGFKQISQLRNHKVVHLDRKNMTERRWFSEQKCSTCNRSFSDTKCLRKHMQAVHNKLKPFLCNICGHTSARKAMLQLHLRQHTGEKPFQCDKCDYRTGDHNSLRRHKMRHSGVKPYKCQHCPYACIQAISYKTHMKNKHPGMEGLFCCQLCPFRSVSNENYTNHMSDHKRGILPLKNGISSNENIKESTLNSNEGAEVEQSPSTETITNLEHLQSILPGNSETTQLIYSCLNALAADGTGVLPPGVTTTNNGNTQTITIQIPNEHNGDDREHIYLTIDQPVNLSSDISAYPNAGMVDNEEAFDYDFCTELTSKDVNSVSLEKISISSQDKFAPVSEGDLVKVCNTLSSSCLQVLRTAS